MNKNKKYLSLLIWIGLLMSIGAFIGHLTKSNISTWYVTLNRSPLTPPNHIFGIAWSILYAMIAVSGWLVCNVNRSPKLQPVRVLYFAQLLLNWIWSPLFFSFHLIGPSLLCLCAIIVLVGFIIIKAYKTAKIASLLLIPYFFWLLFASYLNFYIWAYN